MINIIYTILLFNILIIVFKMFEKYKVDNLQGLIVNYTIAGVCSYFFLESDFSLNNVLNSDWIYHAIIIGILFIVVFNSIILVDSLFDITFPVTVTASSTIVGFTKFNVCEK